MKPAHGRTSANLKFLCATLIASSATSTIHAEIRPNSLISDNAVLQKGRECTVWGTARDGEPVTVEFAGQRVSTVAKGGKWRVFLRPMQGEAKPQTMTIFGDNIITLTNILVGDVWVASGQSNMERQLGPRVGQQDIPNWEAEAAAANYSEIREYRVPEQFAFAPRSDANEKWAVCSPETVTNFSAVGYFFARDIYRAERIPVGILFTAVGGTPAESWVSASSLAVMPDFKQDVDLMRQVGSGAITSDAFYREEIANWYRRNDAGSMPGATWEVKKLSVNDWDTTLLPSASFRGFPGVIWFRKEVTLPASWDGISAALHLGKVDDEDTAWVNGLQVGSTDDRNLERAYAIPPGILRPGRNTIAIRVLNNSGPGGFRGASADLRLEPPSQGPSASIPLTGEWRFRSGCALKECSERPRNPSDDYIGVTVLYNAMIAPLQPHPIKGVIWYQGENNKDRAGQYRELFPLLIADWRSEWNSGEFPFLFVQIAPYRDMQPEIREAQFVTLKKSSNTAMAVIVDAGDTDDIHPAHKQVPGERLALAARALAYGETIEFSGPLYESMRVEGSKAVISFTHVGSGLMAKGGALKGFSVSADDKVFVPAKAEINGPAVVVWSEHISKPVAIRYGWANVPEVNLFNKEGLPASPFRTDCPAP
jgi:sialate O-acetylesterase